MTQAVFIGDESLVLQCLDMARQAGIGVTALVTERPGIAAEARLRAIRVIDPTELPALVRTAAVDVLFSVANERIVSATVLAAVPVAINFHDGPLPERKGVGVTTWALWDGAASHGVAWHTMTAEVDGGAVVVDRRFDIDDRETAFSLNARCYEEGLATFPAVLEAVRDGMPSAPQSPAISRWHGRYDRPVAWLDPSLPAGTLDRHVRALDVGPRLRNRFGAMRWLQAGNLRLVTGTEVAPASGRTPGCVTVRPDGCVSLATTDGELVITELRDVDGRVIEPAEAGLRTEAEAVRVDLALATAVAERDEHWARHETFWCRRLAAVDRTVPSHLTDDTTSAFVDIEVGVPSGVDEDAALTAVVVWWVRASADDTVSFTFVDRSVADEISAMAPIVRAPIGQVDVRRSMSWNEVVEIVRDEVADLSRRGPWLADLVARDPQLRERRVEPALVLSRGVAEEVEANAAVVAAVVESGGANVPPRLRLRVRRDAITTAPDWIAGQIEAILVSAASDRHTDARHLVAVGADEQRLLDDWNDTALPYDATATIDGQFRHQAHRSPSEAAVTSRGRTLTYAELLAEVDAFAHILWSNGVRPGDLVGVMLDRDVELLVAVLGVLTAGAAYVPLDPDYPAERLDLMMEDAGISIVVAEPSRAPATGDAALTVVTPRLGNRTSLGDRVASHGGRDLAYVIYTSGSTGRPKGVMLEHRNVVNFFAAMDQVIDDDPGGTWLAVTSLSFDISVLELLWTVTRGLHVVVQGESLVHRRRARAAVARPMSLSLFFFAAGDAQASEGYRLLRQSAQFADANGFEAIWVPERHFHEFGGAYPNPSVLAAAVAAITSRVAIRAGSVVLPLHSPARVAEEWSVVDNLSGGRVGISFAPGWQPNDFVLNPSAYAHARRDLEAQIAVVQALWHGDAVEMTGPDGDAIAVRTLPRPVQTTLPVWLTSAGSPETFARAGRMGVNLLTHLLGQSVEQLGTNIAAYREAWRAAGHDGDGHVTVMLHTYLCDTTELAKRVAAEPLKRYLGSATGLLKNLASAFPTLARGGAAADEAFRSLDAAELDELLTVATDRYLDTSGLFGSVEDAHAMAAALATIGVDELAALIDFGIDTAEVLASLELLGQLHDRLASAAGAPAEVPPDSEETVAALVAAHAVTHLQCTPSLAAMLLADPSDATALAAIRHLMVGGEALPEKLAKELRAAVRGRLTNMYGPTETTIWSLVHEIDSHSQLDPEPAGGPVPIGRPIANTTIHVLDDSLQPLPIGCLGELHIGGDGVARGYLNREDTTAQRFVEHPRFGRLYATGDLARIREGGIVEFAGRVDFQVKIRGHRIELGEVETCIDAHPEVERSVVVARGDASTAQLVAFVVPRNGTVDIESVRRHAAASLPAIMVPDVVAVLRELPLTPNGKVDRAALPHDLDRPERAPRGVLVAPVDDVERLVASVWSEQLGIDVGRGDNFFDVGGHSLLAVGVFRRLQAETGLPIALTDVFRYPTVDTFAAHLRRLQEPPGADAVGELTTSRSGTERGALRRRAQRQAAGAPREAS